MALSAKKVVVIGGGIAGIQAALDLADMGIKVDLIEKEPCIGGRMAQLDKTFPTNDCSICILSPKLSDCSRHPNITIHTLSQVKKLEKKDGHFLVTIDQKARFVSLDDCINCGLCLDVCPSKSRDKFDMYLRKRTAIYPYFLQGVPAVMVIDKEKCINLRYYKKNPDGEKNPCGKCVEVCSKDAINFKDKDKEYTIQTGSVIISTGFDQYDPTSHVMLGYGKFKNIVTGLEYERMICASGPSKGVVERPSDKKHPKKIAFIQCVGSRDVRHNPYCSAVCCTYGTKAAILSYEHDNEVESTIFYIDLRAGGKGFQKYIERAKSDYNVKYMKGAVSKIHVDSDKNPILFYEDIDAGIVKEKTVDLVVLNSTMVPSEGSDKLAEILGVEMNQYSFIKTDQFHPINTSVDGIYVCGCSRGPTDIPTSVTEASGAAAKAAEYISSTEGV
jgi:heterodisulfide reductase subunit A